MTTTLRRLALPLSCAALLMSGCASRFTSVPAPAPAPAIAPPSGMAAIQTPRMSRPARTMDVWMLNVGQGACTFIACPDGKSNILVDCGSDSLGATPDNMITQWINEKNQAATNVTVLVSHGHRDHISMLREKDGVNPALVNTLMLGGMKDDYTKAFHAWASKVQSPATYFKAAEFKANDSRFQCGTARVDLLTANATEVANPASYSSKKNADSAIVRVSLGKHAVIIPGDAEGISEQSAIDNAARHGLELTGATLLIASHHGANTHGSNGNGWLDAASPHAGAFSAKIDATHRHPRCDIVAAYKDADKVSPIFDMVCGNGTKKSETAVAARLFNTHENGHVLARITSGGVKYLCQTVTPSCDAELPEEMMP